MLILDFYSLVIKGFILGLFFILFYFFKLYTNTYADYSNSAIQIILLSFICILFLILSSVFHFFILYVILEALTFSLVTLYVVSSTLSFSVESALKYYYLNVIASAFILFSLLILHFGTYSFDFLILKTQLLFFSSVYNQFFFNYFFIFFFFWIFIQIICVPLFFMSARCLWGFKFSTFIFICCRFKSCVFIYFFAHLCLFGTSSCICLVWMFSICSLWFDSLRSFWCYFSN